jgi:drug/metabolite transporter (DMT)-like permease
VAPISSINLFGILTAVVFLKESWSLNYCFAFICICLGIYLIFKAEWHFTSLRSFFQSSGGSILASFFWGVSYSLFKYPITWMGVLPFSFLLELCVTLFAGGILVFQNQPWKPMPLLPIRVLALCIILGSIFLHISYQTATVTQIIFVSKSQLLMTLFFGQILYKEKLDFQKSIGVLLLIFSIYLAI